MINWIMNHKKVSGIIFLILFILLIIFLIPTKNTSNQTNIVPTSTPKTTPVVLKLISFYPESGNIQVAGTQTAISLFFNTLVDVNSIKAVSTPTFNFKIGILADQPNRIILTPQSNWISGVKYSIKVTYDVNKSFNINYNVQEVPSFQFME